jgi:adenosylcobinamide-GDP ribazoletransferase
VAVPVAAGAGEGSLGAGLVAVACALLASASVTLVCGRWLRRRLGGFTGDTLGATQQLVELAALLAWLACLPLTGAAHA